MASEQHASVSPWRVGRMFGAGPAGRYTPTTLDTSDDTMILATDQAIESIAALFETAGMPVQRWERADQPGQLNQVEICGPDDEHRVVLARFPWQTPYAAAMLATLHAAAPVGSALDGPSLAERELMDDVREIAAERDAEIRRANALSVALSELRASIGAAA